MAKYRIITRQSMSGNIWYVAQKLTWRLWWGWCDISGSSFYSEVKDAKRRIEIDIAANKPLPPFNMQVIEEIEA